MGIIKSIFVLMVGAVLATFMWSNYDSNVVISFTDRFRTIPIPLSNALVIALVLGILLAVTLSIPNQFKLRGRIRELRRKVERLESEVSELRTMPLADKFSEKTSADEEATESSPSS